MIPSQHGVHDWLAAGMDVVLQPGYVTDVITDNAIAWLDKTKSSVHPFYLSVHYTAPHSPWSRENHPADLYDEYFKHCAFTSVPDGLIAPDWVKYKSIPVNDPQHRRENLCGYFAAVTAMDRNIGRSKKRCGSGCSSGFDATPILAETARGRSLPGRVSWVSAAI